MASNSFKGLSVEMFKNGDLGLGPRVSFQTVQISINVD